MEEIYFKYFTFLMKWAFGLKNRKIKGGVYIYNFEDVKVALINSKEDKKVFVFYFNNITKDIHRVFYTGYHAPELRKNIVYTVASIKKNEGFFEDKLKKRRCFSYNASSVYKSFKNNKK